PGPIRVAVRLFVRAEVNVRVDLVAERAPAVLRDAPAGIRRKRRFVAELEVAVGVVAVQLEPNLVGADRLRVEVEIREQRRAERLLHLVVVLEVLRAADVSGERVAVTSGERNESKRPKGAVRPHARRLGSTELAQPDALRFVIVASSPTTMTSLG